ncbi:MAG: trypsin-like serine peptidase [Hyphomicrobium sp.]
MRSASVITLLFSVACQGCSGLDPAGGLDPTSHAAAPRSSASHSKQAAAPPSDDPSVFEAIADVLASAPIGAKESICADSAMEDVEEFAGTDTIARGDVLGWQKSTLRLRVTHKPLAEEIFRTEIAPNRPGADKFSLGGFAGYAGKDSGICTGTLIGGNIALSAGHCVSREHWDSEGLEFPSYERRGARVFLTSKEFAKLLVADFNRQLDLSPVAANTLAAYADRPYVTFTVRSLLAPDGEPQADLDYAIFRIAGSPEQIGEFALGANKVSYGGARLGTPLVVIQHPDGLYKKVSAGAAGPVTGRRLLHTASTAGGSSGSAVLDARGRIVAVHVEGGCAPMGGTANHALPLSRIRSDLSAALAGRP